MSYFDLLDWQIERRMWKDEWKCHLESFVSAFMWNLVTRSVAEVSKACDLNFFFLLACNNIEWVTIRCDFESDIDSIQLKEEYSKWKKKL